MSIRADVIRGHTDAVILAQLLRRDSYGYEINKNIENCSGGEFVLKEATLYTAFRRLEDSGYIPPTGAMKRSEPDGSITELQKRAGRLTGRRGQNGTQACAF